MGYGLWVMGYGLWVKSTLWQESKFGTPQTCNRQLTINNHLGVNVAEFQKIASVGKVS